MQNNLLEIIDLSLSVKINKGQQTILEKINIGIGKGKIVSIIGPSGSGKSMLARTIMRLHENENFICQGQMIWCQEDQCTAMMQLSSEEMNLYRGKEIGWVLQQPWHAFNPTVACGPQVVESLLAHQSMSEIEAKNQVLQMMQQLQLENASLLYHLYPHQLSGGQLQRMAIAAVLIHNPKLIIADEATVSLDRDTEKSIIELLQNHVRSNGCSLLWISHDLPLSFAISDYLYCLDKGYIIDHGTPQAIAQSSQPMTISLLNSNYENSCPPDSHSETLIELKNVNKNYGEQSILNHFNMSIYRRERLGICGNSGSGKSTLAKIIAGLEFIDHGQISYAKDMGKKSIQMVFQQPSLSFNPRYNILQSMHEAVRLSHSSNEDLKKALDQVSIAPELLLSYPHQLSGGQLQRLSIARVLLFKPTLLILDEAVTALDTIHKKQILELLDDLYRSFPMTYLFISHDVDLVNKFCNRIISPKHNKD